LYSWLPIAYVDEILRVSHAHLDLFRLTVFDVALMGAYENFGAVDVWTNLPCMDTLPVGERTLSTIELDIDETELLLGPEGIWDSLRTPAVLRPRDEDHSERMGRLSMCMISLFNQQFAEGLRESITILPPFPFV